MLGTQHVVDCFSEESSPEIKAGYIQARSHKISHFETTHGFQARRMSVNEFSEVESDYKFLLEMAALGLKDPDFQVREASVLALTDWRREIFVGKGVEEFNAKLAAGRFSLLLGYLATDNGKNDGFAAKILEATIHPMDYMEDEDAFPLFERNHLETAYDYLFSLDSRTSMLAFMYLRRAYKRFCTLSEKRINAFIDAFSDQDALDTAVMQEWASPKPEDEILAMIQEAVNGAGKNYRIHPGTVRDMKEFLHPNSQARIAV